MLVMCFVVSDIDLILFIFLCKAFLLCVSQVLVEIKGV